MYLARLGLLFLLLAALGAAHELNVTRIERVVVLIDGKEVSFTRIFAINSSEIAELEEVRSNLTQRVVALQELLANYSEQANDLGAEVGILRSKLAQLSQEYDYLLQRKEEVEQAFGGLRREQESLRNIRSGSVVLSRGSAAMVAITFVVLALFAYSIRKQRGAT